MFSLSSAALRALVPDDACVSANRVTVNRMVDRAVAYADFLHVPYDLFKGGEVVERVTVKLDVADVTCIGKCMLRSFNFKLFKSVDFKVNRNVERVGVVIPVGNTLDDTKALLVHLDKSA